MSNKIKLFFFTLSLLTFSGILQTIAQTPISSFSNAEVKLNPSWIKQREILNTAILHQLDPERLLHNFRVNAGLPSSAKPLEGWESPDCGLRGHFLGHYLSACATLIAKDADTLLSRRIKYIIGELGVCQQNLGGKYLSAFPETDFDTLENKYGGVWAPYYTYHKIMQGLLDVSTKTGNDKAYKIVLGMAGYVAGRMQKLSAETIDKILYTPQANPSNEAGGMNEVLHNLYAVSKDPKHLELAGLFDRDWFFKPLRDGRDILSGLHSNTHVVLVNGFARRFENTHESEYSTAALNFWEMLYNHHCYVNGSSSGPRPIATTPTSRIAEHWGVADHLTAALTGEIAESCVTHNTQKLTANLFYWTAAPEYADAYMNTFYNAVLPIQNSENGAVVYHLPLGSPRTKNFLKENDYKCCNGSGIEAFTHLNSNIYFHDQNNLWVNLFIPSELNWKEKGIRLEQSTNFPEESKTQIRVSVQKPTQFVLKLLNPSWANAQTMVYVNGQPFKTRFKPLSFITIDRIWTDGDLVDLVFAYDFHLKSMPDNKNVVALFYGPVLLAFETSKELILKGESEEILHSLSKNPEEFSFSLKNNGTDYKLVPFYQVSKAPYGVYASLISGSYSNDEFTENATGSILLNIAYADKSSAQKMDLYLPEGTGPFPVVVLIHGGAFKMGDKSMEASNAAALVAKGIAAASINYRLSGEARFPAQIEDCKAAVRFLRANAAKYNLNPDKIGSWGASAGGNLSSLLGTSYGIDELEGASLGNTGFSSKVIASVDWFGPINFLTMDAEASALGFTITTNSTSSPESQLIGAAVQTVPEKVAKSNPTTYITSDDAAFFIQVGNLDHNIPYTQSLNFYNALKQLKGAENVTYELLEGAGHGGSQFSSAANLAKVVAFFEKYLK